MNDENKIMIFDSMIAKIYALESDKIEFNLYWSLSSSGVYNKLKLEEQIQILQFAVEMYYTIPVFNTSKLGQFIVILLGQGFEYVLRLANDDVSKVEKDTFIENCKKWCNS